MKKLPAIFYPETTDIYDMKNMPRLCYCIHALSMHMFKLGLAPQIHDLEGQLKFTAEEITAMQDKDIRLILKMGISSPNISDGNFQSENRLYLALYII